MENTLALSDSNGGRSAAKSLWNHKQTNPSPSHQSLRRTIGTATLNSTTDSRCGSCNLRPKVRIGCAIFSADGKWLRDVQAVAFTDVCLDLSLTSPIDLSGLAPVVEGVGGGHDRTWDDPTDGKGPRGPTGGEARPGSPADTWYRASARKLAISAAASLDDTLYHLGRLPDYSNSNSNSNSGRKHLVHRKHNYIHRRIHLHNRHDHWQSSLALIVFSCFDSLLLLRQSSPASTVFSCFDSLLLLR
jgi:hypothetical protein